MVVCRKLRTFNSVPLGESTLEIYGRPGTHQHKIWSFNHDSKYDPMVMTHDSKYDHVVKRAVDTGWNSVEHGR